MDVWGELFKIISGSGVSLLGLPGYIFMSVPFIAGLVLGFLVKKALKVAIIGLVAMAAALYFGVINMGDLKQHLQTALNYGPEAMQYAAMLFAMLPLGTGFAVGLIVGLKFA